MASAQNQKEHNARIVAELTQNPDLLDDKRWRMGNLYWIITKSGTKELFLMNRAQRHFFENYLNPDDPKKRFYRHIILKARQLGFTTFIDLWTLDEILFNTNREALVIAHTLGDATEIFDRKIDYAIRNMAVEIKSAAFKLVQNSAKKIQVIVDYGPEEGSTSSIQVSNSGRSGTFFYVHISEFAKLCLMYPQRAAEVETGTFPAVPLDGSIFIESTAEGMAGRFYELFNEGWLNRENITPMKSRVMFMPHFYNWQYDDAEMAKITETIPTSQMEVCEINWAEYQSLHSLSDLEITYYYMKWLQMGGKNSTDAVHKLHQEFPTTPEEAFLSTGQTYFPTSKVFTQLQNAKPGKKGELVPNADGTLTFAEYSGGDLEIFEMPEPGMRYIIGGDTAEGLAHGDKQVLYVLKHKTEKCVALYRSSVAPDEFAGIAYNVGKFFNWALLAIESNKDGLWVNDALDKLGYVNLYYRKVFDDITKNVTKFFGWKTTSATRPFALAALLAKFIQKGEGFPAAILNEMVTFLRNAKGRPEALAGKHDDCFVKGTMILTDHGERPIEEIRVGDLVMTRKGYRAVEMTRSVRKPVISRMNLIGSPEHPLILADGEKSLDSIRDDDILHIWDNEKKSFEKRSYTEGKGIIGIPNRDGGIIESISGGMTNGRVRQYRSIDRFILMLLEKFQKVCLCITKIIILSITLLRIWDSRLSQNMRSTTHKIRIVGKNKVPLQKNKDSAFTSQEQSGERLRKGLSSIRRTRADRFILKIRLLVIVLFARVALKALVVMLSIVQVGVKTCTTILELARRRKVYNLQIQDVPEYVANGILVHNCIMASAIAYAVLGELGAYADTVSDEQETSMMKMMFGEVPLNAQMQAQQSADKGVREL